MSLRYATNLTSYWYEQQTIPGMSTIMNIIHKILGMTTILNRTQQILGMTTITNWSQQILDMNHKNPGVTTIILINHKIHGYDPHNPWHDHYDPQTIPGKIKIIEGRNVSGEDIHEVGTRFARAILEKEEKESLKVDGMEGFAGNNNRSEEFFDAQATQQDNSGSGILDEILLPEIPSEESLNDISEPIDQEIEARLIRTH